MKFIFPCSFSSERPICSKTIFRPILILIILLDRVDLHVVFFSSIKQRNLQKASRLVDCSTDKPSDSQGFYSFKQDFLSGGGGCFGLIQTKKVKAKRVSPCVYLAFLFVLVLLLQLHLSKWPQAPDESVVGDVSQEGQGQVSAEVLEVKRTQLRGKAMREVVIPWCLLQSVH